MIKPEISPLYVLTEEQYDELINSIDEIEETSFNEGYEVGYEDGYEEFVFEIIDSSFEEGRKLGYQEGLDEGYEIGVNDQDWEDDLDEDDLDEEFDDEWENWEKDEEEPENVLSGLVFGYDGEKDKQAMLSKMRSLGYGSIVDIIEKSFRF